MSSILIHPRQNLCLVTAKMTATAATVRGKREAPADVQALTFDAPPKGYGLGWLTSSRETSAKRRSGF